jgi:hypothetical protein
MIWGKTELGDGYRFFICLFLGIAWGLYVFFEWKSSFNKKSSLLNWISYICAAVSFIFSFFPNKFYEYFSIGVDSIYDKSLTIDFEKELNKNSEEDIHAIFVLDRTSYKKDKLMIPSDLETSWEIYKTIINPYHIINDTFNKKIPYREFCRAKLCADLISFKLKGKYSIFLIENDMKPLDIKDGFPVNIDSDYIKTCVSKLYLTPWIDTKDTESDLWDFYNHIDKIIEKDVLHIDQFTKYVLLKFPTFP